jgi:uncharacterized protein (DUF2141 family)
MMNILFILLLNFFRVEQTGTLTVNVQNVPSAQGSIRMAVYNNEKSFPSESQSFRGGALTLKPGINSPQLTFDQLPFGNYAVAVYHDANNNGKMDKNTLGIPTEPYAFSNNIKVKWRAPKFQEAMFTLNTPNKEISVVLKRWSGQE